MSSSLQNNHLNQSQIDAISKISGPVLILAGAGTGKTTTLVARTAKMIESNITEILAVTFTNKAAREMSDRINSLNKSTNGGLELFTEFQQSC